MGEFTLTSGHGAQLGVPAEGSAARTEDPIAIYRMLRLIRTFEESAGSLLAAGRIPGFVHLSIGQEAVAVGVCSRLRPTDVITTNHRGHGHCIAKGGTVDRMMAELFGKPEGYCRGRSGSMHVADPSVGILGANAIVAAQIVMATGAALSAQVLGRDDVAVAFFGEGALAEGIVHESMNMAALWKLPVIFVCENNQYAEHSHVSTHLSMDSVASFAEPYGIPAGTFDGNDVDVVGVAVDEAINRARRGDGPTLLEFSTYRWRGHFEGDPMRYREAAELEEWKLRDPLLIHRSRILASEATEATLAAIDEDVEREVAAAVEWAAALDDPLTDLLWEDVYRSSIGDDRMRAVTP